MDMESKILIWKIQTWAEKHPEKVSVVFKKNSLTYEQLWRGICGVGNLLRQKGVRAGDHVSFSAVSKPEMIIIYLGIQFAGGVAVFLDKNATSANMALICKDAEARLLITDKSMGNDTIGCEVVSLRKLVQQASLTETATTKYDLLKSENDIAELIYTTGTTGRPKGVMLSYKAIHAIMKNTAEGVGIRHDEVILLPLPLNHSYGLRVLRAALWQGATVVLQNGFTFAKEVENNINLFNCTALAAVPASYELMKGQMQDQFVPILNKLRYFEFSAGSLSVRQRKEIVSLFPNQRIINTWGSSESGGAIFCDVQKVAIEGERIESLGKAIDGVKVKVLDAKGNEMLETSLESPGRMALKGDNILSGYWNNELATADSFQEGWFVTNDLVYVDTDGYIYMLGRTDDIINTGGEKVSPVELENIAGQYPDVRECAVVGMEDETLGQAPAMFVSVHMSYDENSFRKFLADRLEKYKMPREIITVESLPRNSMQKIDRKTLKQSYHTTASSELTNPILQAIIDRRSVRKFQDIPIPREILKKLVEAGYHAPSGHNMQTWQFTMVTSKEKIYQLKEKTKETCQAYKVNFYGFENPQALILVSNDKRNALGCQDASCATENIMLAAASFGIGAVWLNPLMTIRDKMPVKELLDQIGIPSRHIVWSMIGLGYPLTQEQQRLQKKTNCVKWVE